MEADFFNLLLPWHWWVLGIVLIILEMLVPTGHTLWLGLSAMVVGVLLWLLPNLNWQFQLLIFAILSLASVLAYKQYTKNKPDITDAPGLNRRGEQYVGRVFTIDEPIVNGVGKVKVNDTTWRVNGQDLPVGTNVKVVSVSGSSLDVVIAE